MGLHCGIDLGTTYSAISWYEDINNRVVTVHLNTIADGQQVVPSVVYFPDGGQDPIIGKVAQNAKLQSPERVVDGIKRSMGTDYKFGPVDGREYTPQEISAEILKALVNDAKTDLGEEVTDVVITVPAYFGDNERKATQEAGELAGLNVTAVLPEPHAAALAYSVEKADEISSNPTVDIAEKYLLVYDLGGGTFDVTLVHTTTTDTGDNALNLKFETLHKEGNPHRGGLDWDDVLAGIVGEKIMDEHGVDVEEDPRHSASLRENCEQGKRLLSAASPAYIVACMGQYQAEISRTEFEDRTSTLLLETRVLLEKVLASAEQDHNINKDDIIVMLTGGSTKMPMVREMIEEVMGRPPLEYGNPEFLVSNGAAYWAHLLQGGPIKRNVSTPDGDTEEIEVTVVSDDEGGLISVGDIVPYAVGVEVLRLDSNGDMAPYNAVVAPVDSPQGETFEKIFRKNKDGMKQIPIVLYKSDTDTEDLGECTELATFMISGLPDGGKKGEEVRVQLGHDTDGILRGEAVDLTTGNKVDIEFHR